MLALPHTSGGVAALHNDREDGMGPRRPGVHGRRADGPVFFTGLHDLVDLVRGLDLRGASYSLETVRRLSCGRVDGVAAALSREDAIDA